MLPPPAPDAFTFVVLPDTQIYSAWKHDTFRAQTAWIAASVAAHRICAVVHVGDVTNDNSDAQWTVASGAMATLDGMVPYVLVPGNHDLGPNGGAQSRASGLDRFFPPERLAAAPLGGSFVPESVANAYRVVETPAGPWLLLGLEFGARPSVLRWARGVLDAHAHVPALVATHAYLYSDGLRYDRADRRAQDWHPDIYGLARGETPAADGADVYRALIAPCANVRLVVCGHVLHEGTARRVDVRPDGAPVHQILANYQHRGEGGDGYLRCLRIAPARRAIEVRTYSPLLARELDDPANRFELQY